VRVTPLGCISWKSPTPHSGEKVRAEVEVVLGRELPGGDARGSCDARLGVQDVVVVAGHPHGALLRTLHRGLLGPRAAVQQAPGGVVVEAEVHRGDQGVRLRPQLGHAVLDHVRPAASQPLSTADRKGTSGEPSAGHVVSRAPVAGSYQLKNCPPGPRSRRARVASVRAIRAVASPRPMSPTSRAPSVLQR
jgi:hypothetical protein